MIDNEQEKSHVVTEWELDRAIIQVAERKPAVKPGAAKAAAHA